MQFQLTVGQLRTGLASLITLNKRNFANQKKLMLPAVAAAVQADIDTLERIYQELENTDPAIELVVTRKAEIVKK